MAKMTDDERRARQRERTKRYREQHPERVRESAKRWRDENRELVKERNAAYRRDHPDRAKAAQVRWAQANRERRLATRKAWEERNKAHVLAKRRERYARRSAEIRAQVNRERAERKQALVALMGGRCVDCGEVPHLAAFEFDHHNGDKVMNVSALLARPSLWEQAVIEASKCELVCANCHRVRTATRTGIL